MNLRTLGILLRKEVKLNKRNPFIPRIIVMLPLMVMLVLPLVANMDVKNVGVVVVDNDRSQLSRRIIADIDASEYLTVTGNEYLYSNALLLLEKGGADAIVVIPRDYADRLEQGELPKIEINANGVNATKGGLGAKYAAESIGATVMQWKKEQGVILPDVESYVLNCFNTTLNFRNYMIPALMVVLIILVCGFLPTLNLMGEKESGTIEAMNVTPVGKFTFVLSKLIPYWSIALFVVTVGMLIGWAVYGLVPAGNIIDIYLASLLFGFVMSGMGVTIANKSATIMQSIFVTFAFIMVFQLMSGLFTPISSMPQWAQTFTYLVPPRYFIEIMRSVYLKGTPIGELGVQYLALTLFAIAFCGLAALTYSKRN